MLFRVLSTVARKRLQGESAPLGVLPGPWPVTPAPAPTTMSAGEAARAMASSCRQGGGGGDDDVHGRVAQRVPGYHPSVVDRKLLLWAGRFKREDDIPEVVTYEMVNVAKNKVRVKVCYFMMLLTIIGCFVMIASGKQAAQRNESLTVMNLAKKAERHAEALREKDAITAKSG
ncbi:protein FAM162B [Lethenteron reissneri]|uniref:protein FAM162B n=1 Tax=Lethenteron reissneri TaxID=7753 RepID=UPI002AB641C8|nr:protein FAM162B [Lethenteron reissneri]